MEILRIRKSTNILLKKVIKIYYEEINNIYSRIS